MRRPIIVYNAAYDGEIVNQCCRQGGLNTFNTSGWLCAMLAYSDFDGTLDKYGKPKWHKLDAAAARFGIHPGGHRACADANTARLVVLAMARSG